MTLILRDKIAYAVLGAAGGGLLLVVALSTFSMRQVQELSVTLTLSFNAFFLLILGVLLGTSTLWREIDRHYLHAVLTLPNSRSRFFLGKFAGLTVVLLLCTAVLGGVAALVVLVTSLLYPSEIPVAWMAFCFAVLCDGLKAVLIAVFALLFSTVATSFYLPFFASIAVYLAGNAVQEVYEYVHHASSERVSTLLQWSVDALYYLLPNFSVFNYKVQAIYSLPVSWSQLAITIGYFFIYFGLVLGLALFVFGRRQFS